MSKDERFPPVLLHVFDCEPSGLTYTDHGDMSGRSLEVRVYFGKFVLVQVTLKTVEPAVVPRLYFFFEVAENLRVRRLLRVGVAASSAPGNRLHLRAEGDALHKRAMVRPR